MDQDGRRAAQDPSSRPRLGGVVLCIDRDRLQPRSHPQNSGSDGMNPSGASKMTKNGNQNPASDAVQTSSTVASSRSSRKSLPQSAFSAACYIFGFSRGAYTARSLAGLIAKLGVLKPGSPIGIAQLYDRYKRGDEETIWRLADMQSSGNLQNITTEERWLLKYSQRADVKMVGVWDTVGSLGLKAFSIEGISRSTFDFLETGLRIHILS